MQLVDSIGVQNINNYIFHLKLTVYSIFALNKSNSIIKISIYLK